MGESAIVVAESAIVVAESPSVVAESAIVMGESAIVVAESAIVVAESAIVVPEFQIMVAKSIRTTTACLGGLRHHIGDSGSGSIGSNSLNFKESHVGSAHDG